jgi:hypothetical protein
MSASNFGSINGFWVSVIPRNNSFHLARMCPVPARRRKKEEEEGEEAGDECPFEETYCKLEN